MVACICYAKQNCFLLDGIQCWILAKYVCLFGSLRMQTEEAKQARAALCAAAVTPGLSIFVSKRNLFAVFTCYLVDVPGLMNSGYSCQQGRTWGGIPGCSFAPLRQTFCLWNSVLILCILGETRVKLASFVHAQSDGNVWLYVALLVIRLLGVLKVACALLSQHAQWILFLRSRWWLAITMCSRFTSISSNAKTNHMFNAILLCRFYR